MDSQRTGVLNHQRCWLAIVMLASFLAAWGTSVRADEPNHVAGLRTLIVPADQPQSWPEGQWEIVDRDDFERFLGQRSRPKSQPNAVHITEANYQASFVDGILQGGRFQANIVASSPRDTLLSLDPFGLAVADLAWQRSESTDDETAVLGRTRTGALQLVVPAARQSIGQRTLLGAWSLAGHAIEDSVSFDFRLLPATTSSLTLTLPHDYQPIASVGVVSRTDNPAKDKGTSRWQIDLSHAQQLKLQIQRVPEQTTRPFIVTEREISWLLQQSEAQIQARFDLSVSDKPATTLQFLVPKAIQLYAVTYGGEPVLSWRVADTSNRDVRQVSVELPEPLLGKGRPVRLSGLMPTPTARDSQLPTIELEESALVGSRTSLAISNQLEVKLLSTEGFRQTKSASAASGQTTFAFEQMHPDAAIGLRLDTLDSKQSIRVLGWLDTRPSHWQMKANVTVSTHAGQTFSIVCRLSNDWEPTDIHSVSGAKVSQWELGQTGDGQRQLDIEFREAVTPERPVELLIQARRLPTSIARQIRLPLLYPENTTSWSSIVGVTSEIDQGPRIVSSEPKSVQISKTQLPTYATGPLVDEFLKASKQVQIFHFRTPTDHADLLWDHGDAAFTAEADLLADLQGNELHEQMTVTVTPSQHAMSGLDFALRSPASDWSWQLLQNDRVVRSLDPVRHAHVPSADGRDRYHFRLEPPVSGRFQIVGTGSRPRAENTSVELPTLPNARSFFGRVELQCPNHGFQLQTEHLQDMPPAMDDDEFGGMVTRRMWVYDQDLARLTIQSPPKSVNAVQRPLAELSVDSISSLGSQGWDRYRAVYRFYNPQGAQPRRFELPESARLESVQIDDATQAVTKNQHEYELPQSSTHGMRVLEIRYAIPTAQPAQFRTAVSAILPTIDVQVIRWIWQLTTPPDWQMVAANGSLECERPPTKPTLSQRVFGPLGLDSDAKIFNPLSLADWQSMFGVTREEVAEPTPSATSESNAPPDWITWQSTSVDVESRGSLEFVQRREFQLIQWWLLLFCCLGGVTFRVFKQSALLWLSAAWFAASIAGSLILNDPYAQCCGAMTVGLLLAALLPVKWLRSFGNRSNSSNLDVEIGSTATIQRSSLILRLILLVGTYTLFQILANSASNAAEPTQSASQKNPILPQQWDLLLPQDQNDQPLDYVYVRKTLWTSLASQTETAERPRYLLTKSNFTIENTHEAVLNIVAKLTVYPLNGESCVVTLPLPRTRLAERADCLLDGKPCFPTTNSQTGDLEIEIPRLIRQGPAIAESAEARLHPKLIHPPREIQLRLRTPNLERTPQGRLQLKLLQVPETNLSIHFADAVTSTLARTREGTLANPSATKQAVWNLGPVDSVDLSWNTSAETATQSRALKMTARAIITEHPLKTHYDWKLERQWNDRSGSSCVFWLPRQAQVENVTAANLTRTTIDVVEQRRRVRLEFQSPPTPKAMVSLKYSLPSTLENQFRVVTSRDFPRLSPDRTDDSELDIAIGLTAATGYVLVPHTMQSTPRTKLLPERFLAEFHSEASPSGKRSAPEVIYQIEPDSRVEFQLVPKQPRRQVRLEQAGRLRDRELLWDVSGKIEITTAPAFQHLLQVPRELQIDSISVLEDETERLARWSRSGDQVTLYLSNGSTGTQRLQIRGHQAIYPETEHTLPLVSVLRARHENTTIRLFSDPHLDVRVNDLAPKSDGEIRATTDTENDLKFLVELTWPHRDDDTSLEPTTPKPEIPKFRYSDQPLEVQVDLATSVSLAEQGDDLTIHWLMRLMNNDCAARPFAFSLPPNVQIAQALATDGEAMTPLVRNESGKDGTAYRLANPLPPGHTEFVLLVGTSPKPEPNEQLPQPRPEGGEFFSRVLAVSPPLQLDVDNTNILTSPNWLEILPELDFPGDRKFHELATVEQPAVSVKMVESPFRITPIVETEIHWLDRGSISAKTLVAMPSGPSTSFEFSWPAEAELLGLLIDDLIVSTAQVRDNRLSVDLPASSARRTIEIAWKHSLLQKTGSISNSLGEADWSFPRLTSPPLEFQGITFFKTSAIRLIPARPPIADLAAFEQSLDEWLAETESDRGNTVRRIRQLIELRNARATATEESFPTEQSLVASWAMSQEKPLPRVWVLRKTTERFVLGGLLFLAALMVSGLIALASQKWTERAGVSLILLGAFWWVCFRWSQVGLVVLLIAAVLMLRTSRKDDSMLEVPSVTQ